MALSVKTAYRFHVETKWRHLRVCVLLPVVISRYLWVYVVVFSFQICDSVGLAKQIAFHSEMVRNVRTRALCSSGIHLLRWTFVAHVGPLLFSFVLLIQDRKATEKKKEQDKAKEKQQEELSKQKQIEKVASVSQQINTFLFQKNV